MFGLFGPEKVEFIDIQDTSLTYRSKRKKHTSGAVAKINLQVFLEGAMQQLRLEVVVDSVRKLPDGSHLIVSHLLADAEKSAQYIAVLSEAPRPDIGRFARRSERVPIGLRVLSHQLPGYRGVTVDISRHGAQIKCEGLLEAGEVLDITFELELNDCPKLTLRGMVVWAVVGEERRKSYRMGIEFTEQHPETQVLWDRSYAYLLKMQSASVMHRSMSSDFSE